jgi:hypothetical protein
MEGGRIISRSLRQPLKKHDHMLTEKNDMVS